MDTLPALQQALARHPELELAIVFGSVAAGRATPESDIDVAVLARCTLNAPQKKALMEDIALATGRAVDLVDLSTVGQPLLGQILRHGKRVLGSSSAHAELMRRNVFDAEDFLPYVSRMLAERRRAWIG